MKQVRPLKALAGLTEEQLERLAEWVEVHSYRKAVELAREEFGRCIPRMTLHRFMGRRSVMEVLDDSPEAVEAAREINRFAATAEANFSRATMNLLERQAFELALARRDAEDLEALKELLFMIERRRANDIHERRVRVLEEKLVLKKMEKANEEKSEEDGKCFSAVVDHVLKNHPAFLAGELTHHRGTEVAESSESAEGNTISQIANGKYQIANGKLEIL